MIFPIYSREKFDALFVCGDVRGETTRRLGFKLRAVRCESAAVRDGVGG